MGLGWRSEVKHRLTCMRPEIQPLVNLTTVQPINESQGDGLGSHSADKEHAHEYYFSVGSLTVNANCTRILFS